MTEPVQYEPKTLTAISAMFTGANGEATADVVDWVTSLMSEGFEVGDNQMGTYWIVNGDFVLNISSNMYVYLDEDGWNAASKGAFEMLYKPSVV